MSLMMSDTAVFSYVLVSCWICSILSISTLPPLLRSSVGMNHIFLPTRLILFFPSNSLSPVFATSLSSMLTCTCRIAVESCILFLFLYLGYLNCISNLIYLPNLLCSATSSCSWTSCRHCVSKLPSSHPSLTTFATCR